MLEVVIGGAPVLSAIPSGAAGTEGSSKGLMGLTRYMGLSFLFTFTIEGVPMGWLVVAFDRFVTS